MRGMRKADRERSSFWEKSETEARKKQGLDITPLRKLLEEKINEDKILEALKKDLNKEKLLKKYIKKNEKLKKTMYKRNNIVFSISKIIFMICCIIIGLSLYKNLLKL